MKTILVDAVDCFVSENGEIDADMFTLLELYPNKKIIVTNANDEQFLKFGLDKMPYDVFTLKHNPEKTDSAYFEKLLESQKLTTQDVLYFEHNVAAVQSAERVGIPSYHYDNAEKNLVALKDFIDSHIEHL